MFKNFPSLLSLFLDFLWINALAGVVIHFFGGPLGDMLGMPVSWEIGITASLLILLGLRVLNVSLGDWLLAYAEAGITGRKWPNLLMGTVGFASGLYQASQWLRPDDGMPFMFLVEPTPMKVFVLSVHGLLYAIGGVLLLRFAPRAKLFNFALIGFGAVAMVVNLLFFRQAMINAQLLRQAAKGLPADMEAAEAVVSASPLYGGAILALYVVLIYLCRERAHRATG